MNVCEGVWNRVCVLLVQSFFLYEVDNVVEQCVARVGPSYGRRTLTGLLRSELSLVRRHTAIAPLDYRQGCGTHLALARCAFACVDV